MHTVQYSYIGDLPSPPYAYRTVTVRPVFRHNPPSRPTPFRRNCTYLYNRILVIRVRMGLQIRVGSSYSDIGIRISNFYINSIPVRVSSSLTYPYLFTDQVEIETSISSFCNRQSSTVSLTLWLSPLPPFQLGSVIPR